jgi:cytochrome c-type biogenesis protein CcmH
VIWRPALAALLLALALAAAAGAVEPEEQLADPALEARAREIGQELRCLVCQNQSIDESDADLARDLRRIVRERLTAGGTDDQVMAFVTARYGDYVLLRPPLRAGTLALWFGPVVLPRPPGFSAGRIVPAPSCPLRRPATPVRGALRSAP